jgi:hypothetical protein
MTRYKVGYLVGSLANDDVAALVSHKKEALTALLALRSAVRHDMGLA